jgi:hypothetical protein
MQQEPPIAPKDVPEYYMGTKREALGEYHLNPIYH